MDKYLGRVGMWLRPHRSRGSGVPQLPGKGRSLTPSAYGTVSQPVCLATLYLLFKSPSRVIIPHSGRRVWVKGRGAGWLIWCLHSTPQAATVRSRRLSISPLVLIGVSRVNRQNELALPRSVTALLLSVYFINLILLMSPDFSCWRPSHYLDPII